MVNNDDVADPLYNTVWEDAIDSIKMLRQRLVALPAFLRLEALTHSIPFIAGDEQWSSKAGGVLQGVGVVLFAVNYIEDVSHKHGLRSTIPHDL